MKLNWIKPRKHAAALLLVFAVLTGCETAEITTADDVRDATVLHVDNYSQSREVAAPSLTMPYQSGSTFALLRHRGSQLQLYVIRRAREWTWISSAYNSSGERLNVIKIDSDILTNLGQVEEHYAINFTRSDLRHASNNDGLDIKLFGKKKNIIVQLPAWYIQGFLQALDDLEKNGQG